MSKRLRHLAILLFGLFVIGGLGFGASTVAGVSTLEECGDDPGELGTCPPFTNQSCNEECFEQDFFGGQCVNQGGQQCCICLT